MIYVANKKRKLDSIQKDHPGAYIFDITSSSPHHSGQIFSPFYPHYNIPIPGDSRRMTATCVEAIWQGLKVFENVGIDQSLFKNDTMKNIKRTTRKFGKPIGHQYGVYSHQILNYLDARKLIYIPAYKYVLDNIPEVHSLIERIKEYNTFRVLGFHFREICRLASLENVIILVIGTLAGIPSSEGPRRTCRSEKGAAEISPFL